jgi:hypothetical protein
MRGCKNEHMKKRIAMAALIGVSIGVCWVMILGAVLNSYSPLRAPWNAIMWASCPSVCAIRTAWWLVPLLNGILYAGVAVSIQFLRKFIRPFA